MSDINLIITGEGGQGIQTIAKAILKTSDSSKQFISYIPFFGVEQRGTPSTAYLIISDKVIRYPKFGKADICVILQQRALSVAEDYISPNTTVLFDSSVIKHSQIPSIAAKKLGLPATRYSNEKFNPKSFNVIIYGAVAQLIGLKKEDAEETIIDILSDKLKNKDAIDNTRSAFRFGFEAVLEISKFSKAIYTTQKEINIFKSNDKIAQIDPNLCKGCGICVEKCPVNALAPGSELGVFATPVPTIDISKCIACGNCKRFCPDGAVSVEKKA